MGEVVSSYLIATGSMSQFESNWLHGMYVFSAHIPVQLAVGLFNTYQDIARGQTIFTDKILGS